MSKFIATTESGAVYTIDTKNMKWRRNQGQWSALESISYCTAEVPKVPWRFPEEWDEVPHPVIGKRMYLKGYRPHEWAISTEIASVREEPDED